MPIHRKPPDIKDQVISKSMIVTGIKAIDLLTPYPKGGARWACSVARALAKRS